MDMEVDMDDSGFVKTGDCKVAGVIKNGSITQCPYCGATILAGLLICPNCDNVLPVSPE